jgi:8-oxo-dGTP diphosphatase
MKVAVDAVVFAYSRKTGLSILLIKRKYPPFEKQWALPGGFVLENETLNKAVVRELKEETGVSVNYLEQLYTYGELDRDPRERIISVSYYALIKHNTFMKLTASTDAEEASWFQISKLPKLAFDHKSIIQQAFQRLQNKIKYKPIGFELLDKQFSFADLEHLYASVLDKPFDRRNFSKKILSLGLLTDTGLLTKEGVGRPSKIYTFNKKQYELLEKQGFYFEI